MEEKTFEKSTKRDDYYRCPVCKKLYSDRECTRNPLTGVYICPKNCVKPFIQPQYESPFDKND